MIPVRKFIFLLGLMLLGALAACQQPATPMPNPTRPARETPAPTRTPTETIPVTGPTQTATTAPTRVPTEDESAKILVESMVRRLTPVVWAGAQAPLPEVQSDDVFQLEPGGFVSTDQSGEAEVTIEDCLKIFLYQGSELIRNTCRESDYESGLAVCSTAGMISVINNCLNQVVIVQTPNSEIVTTGTEFTVMYIEEEDLTVVKVLAGEVEFTPLVLNAANIPLAQAPVTIEADTMIFSTTREIPALINQLPEREVLPLDNWEALRDDLTVKDPYVDLWMESTRLVTEANQGTFPEILVRPTGVVTIEMIGDAWSNAQLQDLVSESVPWLTFIHELWPESYITPELIFPEKRVDDARFLKSDRLTIRSRVLRSPWARQVLAIVVPRGDENAEAFAQNLRNYLEESGFRAEVRAVEPRLLARDRQQIDTTSNAVIYITVSGEAFR